MSYQVLARQYRPQNFQQLVGQEHVSQALMNGLQQQRLHHAFLFTGTRGVGKTTVARILAKALNCEQGVSGEPCGECESCVEISEGRFIDLVEVDAASRTGVDDTRELLENVQYAPSKGRYKIYLIDEVHMFSNSSFNALLKTLEEPPPHVKFLLATTEPKKLPVTVLSRCLQFNLKRLTLNQIKNHLNHLLDLQEISHETQALELIARAADGSMRDGLSLLDQALAFGGGQVMTKEIKLMLGTIEQNQINKIMTAIQTKDGELLHVALQDVFQLAPDYSRMLDDMALLMHEISLYQILHKHQEASQFSRELITELAQGFSEEQIQLFYQILIKGKAELSLAPDRKTGFEMTILRLFAFEIDSFDTPLKQTPAQQSSSNTQQPHQARSTHNPQNVRSEFQQPQQTQTAVEPEKSIKKDTKPSVESLEKLIEKMPLCELNSARWETLFEKMALKGTARELARNAQVLSVDGNILTLAIDRQAHLFMTEKATAKLHEQLKLHIEDDFRLELSEKENAGVEKTIARKQQDSVEKTEHSIANQIEQSDFVKHMQSEFQAEVIEVKKKA